jgi:hypothetical protein
MLTVCEAVNCPANGTTKSTTTSRWTGTSGGFLILGVVNNKSADTQVGPYTTLLSRMCASLRKLS